MHTNILARFEKFLNDLSDNEFLKLLNKYDELPFKYVLPIGGTKEGKSLINTYITNLIDALLEKALTQTPTCITNSCIIINDISIYNFAGIYKIVFQYKDKLIEYTDITPTQKDMIDVILNKKYLEEL